MSTTPPLLLAIQAAKGQAVDDLLADIASEAKIKGLHVAGFVQHRGQQIEDCCRSIKIEHIASGEMRVISQALGNGSRGCRLDPAVLADVAGKLLSEIDSDIDLLILNRFGKGEMEGHGFRSVIEAAFEKQIPVLTVVRDEYVDGWKEFAGECGGIIQPAKTAAMDWLKQILASEQRNFAVV